jgi:hypothetical protein
MSAEPRPEFPRPLALALVGETGREEHLVATTAECAALAARFGILGIGRLTATLRLRPEADGAVLAEGRLSAEVTQACGVTLEPVVQQVDEPLAFRFLPAGAEPDEEPDAIDELETRHGVAELGEAVAEALALALDPYPRAPDAELPPEAQDAGDNPFGALASLQRGGKR